MEYGAWNTAIPVFKHNNSRNNNDGKVEHTVVREGGMLDAPTDNTRHNIYRTNTT